MNPICAKVQNLQTKTVNKTIKNGARDEIFWQIQLKKLWKITDGRSQSTRQIELVKFHRITTQPVQYIPVQLQGVKSEEEFQLNLFINQIDKDHNTKTKQQHHVNPI